MTTASNDHDFEERYYVPHGSHWPVVGSVGLLFLMVGVSSWLNGAGAGFYIMLVGFAVIIFMLTGWFGTVISESISGLYNAKVDKSFRQGMFWFIFSEVMFFAAFFGALFYARNMSIPWLGGDSNNFLHQPVAVGGLREHLADQRSGRYRRRLRSDAAARLATDQHGIAANELDHGHDRASRTDCRQAHAANRIPRGDLPAGFRLRLFPGC